MRATSGVMLVALAFLAANCGGEATSTPEPLFLAADQSTVAFGEVPLGRALGWGLETGEATGPGPRVSVRSGTPVAVTIENDDELDEEQHDFAVVANWNDRFPEPLWGSKTGGLGFGARTSVTFTPEGPGLYYYVCLVNDHRFRGMYGEFVVEE
jgi:FtsP/CotA-like multicopper oxidase with cupredoxin domain